jgi:hypothetical protein
LGASNTVVEDAASILTSLLPNTMELAALLTICEPIDIASLARLLTEWPIAIESLSPLETAEGPIAIVDVPLTVPPSRAPARTLLDATRATLDARTVFATRPLRLPRAGLFSETATHAPMDSFQTDL